MADDVILTTEGLTKEFKGFTAVDGVALKVRAGRSTRSSARTGPARPPASTS